MSLDDLVKVVELIAVGGGTTFTAAIAVDRWVHGRVSKDRFSDAIGKINVKIINVEKDIIELRTILRERQDQTPRPPTRPW